MSQKGITALIIGSTGLIGQELCEKLALNKKYSSIYAIVRKQVNFQSRKITQIICDNNNYAEVIPANIQVDQYFVCIGSTKKKTPNKKQYRLIDLDYPLGVAKLLKKNGCSSCYLISAIGANSNSKNFYLSLKGEIENCFIKLDFEQLHILRPSLLVGKRNENRIGEKLSAFLLRLLNPFLLGKFRNYQSIQSSQVVEALIALASKKNSGNHIYSSDQIKNIK